MTVLTAQYDDHVFGVNNTVLYDYNHKSPVFCANCGRLGHIYKNCNHPVTSYGVICFRLKLDTHSQCIYPEYLMVQRKDSLSYVEFIRGKYSIDRRSYILQLFTNMTETERENILTKPFEVLWKSLWQVDDCNLFEREYNEAKAKFDILKRGVILQTQDNAELFFNFEYIMNNTTSNLQECEWGFPKGRRNINEHDLSCALREFTEETGVRTKYIKMLKNHKPFEEVFSGSNRVRYKHVYYLAMCILSNDNVVFQNQGRQGEIKEIKDVQWYRYNDAQARIRDMNVERKELFKRINQIVLKNLCLQYNGKKKPKDT